MWWLWSSFLVVTTDKEEEQAAKDGQNVDEHVKTVLVGVHELTRFIIGDGLLRIIRCQKQPVRRGKQERIMSIFVL